MKTPEITQEFIYAVKEGIIALDSIADNLQKNEHFNEESEIGEVIREVAQRKYQCADLLKGWLCRIKRKN